MNRNRMLKVAAAITAVTLTVTSIGYYEFRNAETNVAAEQSKVQQKIEDAINNTINSSTIFGADKEETVYVISDANGNVKKKVVSDWLKNKNGSDVLEDKSDLSNIENVKGDEKYSKDNDGKIIWDAAGTDIYYQGTTDKQLPVDVNVKYYLDGKEMSPKDMAGKSGKVKIRFEYNNNTLKKVELKGKETEMYVPFTMISGMILPADKFSEVEVTDGKGKVISDGNNEMVMGISFSGLKEDLKRVKESDKVNIDIADSFEISANVTDFSLSMTMTVATSDVFSGINVDSLDSIDDIKDTVEKMTDAVSRLASGSGSLKAGLDTLKDGSSQVNEGVGLLNEKTGEFADGLKKVNDGVALMMSKMDEKDGAVSGADALAKGAAMVDKKLKEVQTAVKKLSEGSAELDKSAGSISKAVGQLSEGASTIDQKVGELSKGAGELSKGAQTIDKKLGELNKGIGQLNTGAGTLSEGLKSLEDGLTGTENSVGLTQAASAVSNGVGELANGAGQLESGIGQLQQSMVDTLTQQINENNTLIEQYTEKVKQLMAAGEGYEQQIKQLSDGIAAYNGANAALQGVIDSLTTSSEDEANPSAYDGFNSLQAGASQISIQLCEDADESGNATVKSGVKGIETALNNLATDEENGVPALVNGAETIRKNLDTLANDENKGVPALKKGASTLSGTLGTLAADDEKGIPALKQGTGKVSKGLTELNSKMPAFTKGTGELSKGLKALDTALPALKNGTSDLSGGMNTMLAGLTTLSETVGTELKPGLDTLYSAGLTLKSSVSTLYGYTNQIANGLITADNGSSELADGIGRLKSEAVDPVNDAVNDELDEGIARIKKTVTLGDEYDIYSDAIEGQDTSVKFIYKTEGIK
ncbi:MAG: hypothetical protein K2I03_03605 [Lachnospiraceae bacterium]|nr:hypothetical protein [Lachnospiraceae bacterium]